IAGMLKINPIRTPCDRCAPSTPYLPRDVRYPFALSVQIRHFRVVTPSSWANTVNGKLARRIDQASEQTIPAIAACPKDHGWKREKRDGAYWCFGANPDAKTYNGWLLP
ncbi:hypothetical protein ACQKJZ_15465, partial [Sphingomonas sp. NPDC019816]|uniref:hypothetical protein n=1 Tax=Sphingomonas sp. NPDC019816 TaxID=3390679 RepID=UPI003D0343AE